mgnify:CR=1 FL=1
MDSNTLQDYIISTLGTISEDLTKSLRFDIAGNRISNQVRKSNNKLTYIKTTMINDGDILKTIFGEDVANIDKLEQDLRGDTDDKSIKPAPDNKTNTTQVVGSQISTLSNSNTYTINNNISNGRKHEKTRLFQVKRRRPEDRQNTRVLKKRQLDKRAHGDNRSSSSKHEITVHKRNEDPNKESSNKKSIE